MATDFDGYLGVGLLDDEEEQRRAKYPAPEPARPKTTAATPADALTAYVAPEPLGAPRAPATAYPAPQPPTASYNDRTGRYGPVNPPVGAPPELPQREQGYVAPLAGGGMPEPSFSTAMENTIGRAPQWKDYMPPAPHGWSKVGHIAAAFNPITNRIFNQEPMVRAEKGYRGAASEYDTRFNQQMKLTEEERAQRHEQAEEARPAQEAAGREKEWQQHHGQENEEYDRRFKEQQDKWEKQHTQEQKEQEAREQRGEQRAEEREKRGEGRAEARELRAEGRQEEKTQAGRRDKLQKTFDNARDIDGLENEQLSILKDAQGNGKRGVFGGGPYLNGPQSMQFLANHMALTIGRIKGARTGRDLIEMHVRARSLDQATEALAQRVLSGGVLTYDQAQQMLGTTGVKRASAWQRVWEESEDYGIDVSDRIPAEYGGKAAVRPVIGAGAGGGAEITVQLPGGKTATFKDQESADAFKKKAGIK